MKKTLRRLRLLQNDFLAFIILAAGFVTIWVFPVTEMKWNIVYLVLIGVLATIFAGSIVKNGGFLILTIDQLIETKPFCKSVSIQCTSVTEILINIGDISVSWPYGNEDEIRKKTITIVGDKQISVHFSRKMIRMLLSFFPKEMFKIVKNKDGRLRHKDYQFLIDMFSEEVVKKSKIKYFGQKEK